ncbi:DUF7344 domain-containing protein [Natrinema sp. LN54]|uniref:DUF7344 domain-containing protein n=1 Tax=Natrinema sp. LN54 TaxID=3458705 RepID=UPI0040352191
MEPSDAYRVIASVDRQYLLHELVEHGGESSVRDLARRVAIRRHRTDSANISETEIDRARLRLVHIHLPQLLERDVIDVDWNDGAVALAEDDRVDPLLEAAEEVAQWPPEPQLPQRSESEA